MIGEWSLEELAKNQDIVAANPEVFNKHGVPPAPSFKIVPKEDGESIKQSYNKYHVAPKEDRTYYSEFYQKEIVFDSKREAEKCRELDLAIKAGEIDFYIIHPRFPVGPGIIYEADFETCKAYSRWQGNDIVPLWQVIIIEVKMWHKATRKHKEGFNFTKEAAIKLKLFREKYESLLLEIVK